MSLAAVQFKRSEGTNMKKFDVFTSDFNREGQLKKIGELCINVQNKTFAFKTEETLAKHFFPPEYYLKYKEDDKKITDACKKGNWFYRAWSFLIYKKAMSLMQD